MVLSKPEACEVIGAPASFPDGVLGFEVLGSTVAGSDGPATVSVGVAAAAALELVALGLAVVGLAAVVLAPPDGGGFGAAEQPVSERTTPINPAIHARGWLIRSFTVPAWHGGVGHWFAL